ncbi:MAG TPA: cysteine synthase family protein [Chloroflexota bacterium]|nr:cysteine synthase family protein [Chloroflexota bacterium]
MIYSDILATIGRTPLVNLARISPKPSVRILAKLEGANPSGSLKDRIALAMIENAEAHGQLKPGQTILEPSSGNTGISLALVGRLKGYPVRIVMPDNASVERKQLLELFGAEVVFSDGKYGSNGSIELANELARDTSLYMPYQYGNQANPEAHYKTTGQEIVDDTPDVDVFVAGLGTGGTLMGVGHRLKAHDSRIRIIAVEPEQGDLVQGLRSLEDGFIPPILDLDLLDGKIMCDSSAALRGERLLALSEGIFGGISSGAVIYGAIRAAERMESGTVVALLADGGWKYLSTGLWTKAPERFREDMAGKLWW